MNLPEMPEPIVQLINTLDQPDVSFHQLERIVLASPALSAAVIRTVCSAAYGVGKNASESIMSALKTIGMKELERLAISEWVQAIATQPMRKSGFDAGKFATHSLYVGVLASFLFTRIKKVKQIRSQLTSEQVFSFGLLHDVSVGLVASIEPELFSELAEIAVENGQSVAKVFHKRFHARIETIGQAALQAWKLPLAFQDALWFAENGARHPTEPHAYACVDYANHIAELHSFGVHPWSIPSDLPDWVGMEVGLPEEDLADALELIERHTMAMSPFAKAA